jgi:hypothetical protein
MSRAIPISLWHHRMDPDREHATRWRTYSAFLISQPIRESRNVKSASSQRRAAYDALDLAENDESDR